VTGVVLAGRTHSVSKEETETVGEIIREAAERGDLDGVVMSPETRRGTGRVIPGTAATGKR
jgi:hypothetical protein